MRSRPLLLLILALLVALGFASNVLSADLPPPGTVLSERSDDIGFGFREVFRSQVNSLGAFEGVGHFAYVYYRDELLCQCDRREVAISPDGGYSIFVERNGKLTLFHAATRSRKMISEVYVGHPTRAEWTEKEVVVTLVRYENGTAHRSTLHVPL